MSSTGEPALLRPLSLGEIFDRAVTLYVRNAALFSMIALIVVLPLTVLGYFAAKNDAQAFSQILQQMQHPGKSAPASSPMSPLVFLGIIVISAVGNGVVMTAIAFAVGALYRGEAARWQSAYALAVQRLGSIVALLIAEIVIFAVAVFALAIVVGLTFGLAVVLARVAMPLSIVVGIIAGVLTLGWLVLITMLFQSFSFAFVALGTEAVGVNRAIARGFSRIFNRTEWWRALLVALSLIAVYIGIAVLSMSIAALFEIAIHARFLDAALRGLLSLVSVSFVSILLAVYSFDVRVRREGLDLQSDVDTLAAITARS